MILLILFILSKFFPLVARLTYSGRGSDVAVMLDQAGLVARQSYAQPIVRQFAAADRDTA